MRCIHLLQANRRFAIVQLRYESPVLVFALQHLSASFEVAIQLANVLPEVVQRTLEVAIGHKQVLLYVVLFQLIARFACQDNQLADNILAAQVDAWVGFRVALFLRHSDGFAEGHLCAYNVEDKVQRAAKYGFNFQNFISTMNHVVDGVDDRQSCAYVCLEQEFHATFACCLLQFAIVFVGRACGNLIGGHHRYVVLQQLLV